MAYTVKQVAQLSGVSVRTLHHYDRIGLLKPAYLLANGYRYYEEEQLLMLQQILFFRELGFELAKIRKILGRSDFDRLAALKGHRQLLQQELTRLKGLVRTIDATIIHLQGGKAMEAKQLFQTFRVSQRGQDEQYILERGGPKAEARVAESRRRVASWKPEDFAAAKEEGDAIQRELVRALENGAAPESPEVQALMRRQFHWLERYYTPDREVFLGHAQMFQEHPEYRAFYENLHPKMPEYLAAAMRHFANTELAELA
jgi:MerR family transcriptional regulator, thiopeptide resistance regulator